MDVATWLRELGLSQYGQIFEDNDVDAETLRHLTETDLIDLGAKSVGHRRKLAAAISALREQSPTSAAAPGPGSPPAELAEQRLLTVLYCQMADSGAGIGAEALRGVVQRFHRSCTQVVAEYDGHIANFYGDCMLVYFGWPRAHEDDAERAVRTGLALVRRFQASNDAIDARVGIATGPVVVGDLIREGPAQQQSAVGLTPNLAARVLSLAGPGQVVVDELTHQLTGRSFSLQSLGSHLLKGLARPVSAYAVAGEHAADSRFDARCGRDVTPMAGRDQELALLLERWTRVRSGEGQSVLLVGEAGIGKSRIAKALLDACAGQSHWLVRWQCSPYHTGSALWPVVQRLGREVGVRAQDTAEAVLAKVEALAGADPEVQAVYATLLGLNGSQRYGPLEMKPRMLRERTLELLVEQLFEKAEQRPLLLLVEDAHWVDPTTLELIGRCLERIEHAPMLIVITSRPDNQPALTANPSVTRLSLNRLARASVEAIVARLGGQQVRPHTLATIVEQADGVPLFAEELTKAVLETGETAIPASLHGSLMARLDRVPEVKAIAQAAACIGREFDQALLEAVAEQPETVAPALERLVAAQLVFPRGGPTVRRFIFKHALLQEAARESMLRERRQATHARILAVLERSPDTLPEILAHHAARARAGAEVNRIKGCPPSASRLRSQSSEEDSPTPA